MVDYDGSGAPVNEEGDFLRKSWARSNGRGGWSRWYVPRKLSRMGRGFAESFRGFGSGESGRYIDRRNLGFIEAALAAVLSVALVVGGADCLYNKAAEVDSEVKAAERSNRYGWPTNKRMQRVRDRN